MPYIKTVLILSFFSGFILHYYYEKKVLREKKQSDLIVSSSLMGLISIFPGAIFYFMIYGGIYLWSTDLSDEVFDVNASRDILIPGAIDPPKYSLLSLTTSKVVAVPKSTIITDF